MSKHKKLDTNEPFEPIIEEVRRYQRILNPKNPNENLEIIQTSTNVATGETKYFAMISDTRIAGSGQNATVQAQFEIKAAHITDAFNQLSEQRAEKIESAWQQAYKQAPQASSIIMPGSARPGGTGAGGPQRQQQPPKGFSPFTRS